MTITMTLTMTFCSGPLASPRSIDPGLLQCPPLSRQAQATAGHSQALGALLSGFDTAPAWQKMSKRKELLPWYQYRNQKLNLAPDKSNKMISLISSDKNWNFIGQETHQHLEHERRDLARRPCEKNTNTIQRTYITGSHHRLSSEDDKTIRYTGIEASVSWFEEDTEDLCENSTPPM